jgi:predicted ATPase
MRRPLDRISLRGYKSIHRLEALDLRQMNLLVGANGAGKSNFVEFFELLGAMMHGGLASFVLKHGGGDGFLHGGPKVTQTIAADLEFGPNRYWLELGNTVKDRLYVVSERVQYTGGSGHGKPRSISQNNSESSLPERRNDRSVDGAGPSVPYYVHEAVSDWTVYHFHDTSLQAPLRRLQPGYDDKRLRPDGANLGPFLRRLKSRHDDHYEQIRLAVQRVAPFFADFVLDDEPGSPNDNVRFAWRQRGSDFPFQAWHLSDGTLRFIALATALLQPKPPATLIIDEPELGLHPAALSLLAELLKLAATHTQVIATTQSPLLVDHFEPDDVVVVDREQGSSVFRRLRQEQLASWLEDYSLGELWQKNVLRGGPAHE